MPVTQKTIINAALIMIGTAKLQTIDVGKVAETARDMYDLAVREEFQNGIDWYFAMGGPIELAPSDEAVSGWPYTFAVPAGLGVERIIAQVGEDDDSYKFDGEPRIVVVGDVEFDVWVTKTTPCFIKYVRYRAVAAKWPAYFVKCVYTNLAKSLVPSIVKKDEELIYWEGMLFNARRDADRINQDLSKVTDGAGNDINDGNTDVIDAAGAGSLRRAIPRANC